MASWSWLVWPSFLIRGILTSHWATAKKKCCLYFVFSDSEGIDKCRAVCMCIKTWSLKMTEHYNTGLEHIRTKSFLFSLLFPPQWSSRRGFSCPAPLKPSIMSGPTHHNRPLSFWPNMELKVWVDGVQRVVCGVTEATTCQEVVIALAQAIGKSFCILKEKLQEHFRHKLSSELKKTFSHLF